MYATHDAYFKEFVHMIPNERPTLVSLACNIELFQALFQCRVERAIILLNFFLIWVCSLDNSEDCEKKVQGGMSMLHV